MKNKEGYPDPTAGRAIASIRREEKRQEKKRRGSEAEKKKKGDNKNDLQNCSDSDHGSLPGAFVD